MWINRWYITMQTMLGYMFYYDMLLWTKFTETKNIQYRLFSVKYWEDTKFRGYIASKYKWCTFPSNDWQYTVNGPSLLNSRRGGLYFNKGISATSFFSNFFYFFLCHQLIAINFQQDKQQTLYCELKKKAIQLQYFVYKNEII